jgi:hypothetical protein
MLGAYKKQYKDVTTRRGNVQEMYRGVFLKMKCFKVVEDQEVIQRLKENCKQFEQELDSLIGEGRKKPS